MAADWQRDHDELETRITQLEQEKAELEAKVRELHRALSEGHGVEDGGIWEDRAQAAESTIAKAVKAMAETLSEEGATLPAVRRDAIQASLDLLRSNEGGSQ